MNKEVSSDRSILIQMALILVLGGCGGGGGGGGSATVSADEPTDTDTDTELLQTGVFLDSPVAGLNYVAGPRSGVTDPNGLFLYAEGEDVTFSVGSITLGKATAKPVMTPLDLVEEAGDETHRAVINIARFIQSLDDDRVIGQSISISEEVRSVLADAPFVNFDQTADDFTHDPSIKAALEALNAAKVFTDGERDLVPAAEARAHLTASLAENPVITVNSPNGKEFVISINPYEITWKANSSITNVDIFLSQDGGQSWHAEPIAVSAPNSGSFWWDVPVMSHNNTRIRIRVVDVDNPFVYDDSNDDFTILLPMADLADHILLSEGTDTDRDYLPDDLELVLGTDPGHPDSDRDGISDYAEVMSENFGDFDNIPDLDQDGLIAALDTDDDGDGVHDGQNIDSDGDGIFNYLEINGFTYDWYTDSYELWDGVSFEKPYFKTDPRQLSTDQDPYTDDLEASGKVMDVLIQPPGDLPMVPAYPNIVVRLEGYDVTLNSEITYARGGSLAEGTTWSRQTTVENAFELGINYEYGGEWTVKAGVLDWGEAKASAKLQIGSTWSWTRSSTVSAGESITQESNWQKATTTNPSTAAHVKLKLKVYNFGTAAASNFSPTLTMKIGGLSVLTFSPNNPIGILEPGGVYPAQEGTYWVVDKRLAMGVESDIVLTLDELRMLESGAPLNIEVTQMDGDVMLLTSEGQWEFAGKWGEYIARCEAVSANIRLDLGNGEFIHQLVYADDSASSPVVTFGDALRWIAAYKEWSAIPTITYVDRSGMPQETRLTDWNFIIDKATLLANGIVPGDPAASAELAPTELVLGPDTTILARAPRETLNLKDPEIYYAYYDSDARVVELAAADYNGIVDAFFVKPDGGKHPMIETMPGSGVFTLDLRTIEDGYEPVFDVAADIEGELLESVEVVNRDGASLTRRLHATFSPTRSAQPIHIYGVGLSVKTGTLTASIDFDEYFPPVVRVYLADGTIGDMTKHPMYWDPQHDHHWQFNYAELQYVRSDLEGALVVAEVVTDCNIEPGPDTNGESNCFAIYPVPGDVLKDDGQCGSGNLELGGYLTLWPFLENARYDAVDFNENCEKIKERLQENIFGSGFNYSQEYDLVLKPRLQVRSFLEAPHGAARVSPDLYTYEDIDAKIIGELASPGSGGHEFFEWSTPLYQSREGPEDKKVWVITTSDGQNIKIRVDYVKQTSYFPNHSTGHATLTWAMYE